MTTHKLEDLLDEIQEDEVQDVLRDTNELEALLKAASVAYVDNDQITADEFIFLKALNKKAKEIREDLVRQKYPTDFGSQD